MRSYLRDSTLGQAYEQQTHGGLGRDFIVMLALDGLWLGVIAKNLYQQGMGHLMSPQPRLAFAALFYLLYPVGLLIFAVMPGLAEGSVARAAMLGALFGLFAYATYDLTNLAVVRDWPSACRSSTSPGAASSAAYRPPRAWRRCAGSRRATQADAAVRIRRRRPACP